MDRDRRAIAEANLLSVAGQELALQESRPVSGPRSWIFVLVGTVLSLRIGVMKCSRAPLTLRVCFSRALSALVAFVACSRMSVWHDTIFYSVID